MSSQQYQKQEKAENSIPVDVLHTIVNENANMARDARD